IDATEKGPDEGTRPWPEEIRMTDEVRAFVDRRWDEYGIDHAGAQNGARRRKRAINLSRASRRE
ncbi:MAG TPA: hypothetical protein VE688_09180, partial [Gaiellaceae bacterium]|nr:hypothetical protein [Gaiellaceae bacterium]